MELIRGNIVEDLQRWADAYLNGLRAEGRAKRTLEIYTGILDLFIEFSRGYQEEITIEDINRLFVSSFFNHREATSTRGFSSTTKELYLNVIKQFFLYISENNHDGVDLLKSLRKMTITTEIKLKPAFSEDEVTRILESMEKLKKEGKRAFTTIRNLFMFKLFLYTGMRANELASLRFSDFERADLAGEEVFQILVHGKGKKQRYVFVLLESVEDDFEYLASSSTSDAIIAVSSTGKPLGPVQIWQNLSRIYKRANVSKSGVHILRHTLARRLVARGENLEVIRNILGHAKISTTVDFYAKASEKDKAVALMGLNGKKDKERG